MATGPPSARQRPDPDAYGSVERSAIVHEDTGQLVMLERPARFDAHLRAFLADEPAAGGGAGPALRTLAT